MENDKEITMLIGLPTTDSWIGGSLTSHQPW